MINRIYETLATSVKLINETETFGKHEWKGNYFVFKARKLCKFATCPPVSSLEKLIRV